MKYISSGTNGYFISGFLCIGRSKSNTFFAPIVCHNPMSIFMTHLQQGTKYAFAFEWRTEHPSPISWIDSYTI